MLAHISKYFLLIAILGFILIPASEGQAQIKTVKPLYERLGGYNAIAAVVDDFLGRLIGDAQLKRFFAGHSIDSQKKIRQHIVDQLCQVTGGPCVYTGRDMKTSHAGLNITEEDWNTTVNHLVATLNKFNVPETEKDEVIGALAGLKDQIVENKMNSK